MRAYTFVHFSLASFFVRFCAILRFKTVSCKSVSRLEVVMLACLIASAYDDTAAGLFVGPFADGAVESERAKPVRVPPV